MKIITNPDPKPKVNVAFINGHIYRSCVQGTTKGELFFCCAGALNRLSVGNISMSIEQLSITPESYEDVTDQFTLVDNDILDDRNKSVSLHTHNDTSSLRELNERLNQVNMEQDEEIERLNQELESAISKKLSISNKFAEERNANRKLRDKLSDAERSIYMLTIDRDGCLEKLKSIGHS